MFFWNKPKERIHLPRAWWPPDKTSNFTTPPYCSHSFWPRICKGVSLLSVGHLEESWSSGASGGPFWLGATVNHIVAILSS